MILAIFFILFFSGYSFIFERVSKRSRMKLTFFENVILKCLRDLEVLILYLSKCSLLVIRKLFQIIMLTFTLAFQSFDEFSYLTLCQVCSLHIRYSNEQNGKKSLLYEAYILQRQANKRLGKQTNMYIDT